MTRLEELELELRAGIKKSGQTSLDRGSPDPSSLADLNRAREGLRELSVRDSGNPRVWELLSKAEESLLNFRAAIRCCEKMMELSSKQTKDQRKRLALLKQTVTQRSQLPLTSEELKSLSEYLKLVGADEALDKMSFDHTETWLEDQGFRNPEKVINAFESRGVYSDLQIYHSIVLS